MATYRIIKNQSELLPPLIEGFAEAWQECGVLNARATNGDTFEVIADPAEIRSTLDRLCREATGQPFTGKVIAVVPNHER